MEQVQQECSRQAFQGEVPSRRPTEQGPALRFVLGVRRTLVHDTGEVIVTKCCSFCYTAWKGREITVHFWNGNTATVPLGRVQWVPLAVWKKAVERLHKPLIQEHPWPLLWAPCCSLWGPATGCVTSGPSLGTPFPCPPCVPPACCQLLCQGCLCCCSLAGPTWWPLTRTSGGTAKECSEVEPKPPTQLLPLVHPKEDEASVRAPLGVSSSSSSSSEKDLETDLQMGLPQRLMVDGTVNTDLVLPEKCPRRQGGLRQPGWRYWRNGSEPHPGKLGIPTS